MAEPEPEPEPEEVSNPVDTHYVVYPMHTYPHTSTRKHTLFNPHKYCSICTHTHRARTYTHRARTYTHRTRLQEPEPPVVVTLQLAGNIATAKVGNAAYPRL